MLIMLVTTKKRDNVKIIRIVLDLHDAIVDSKKVVLFECE